MPWRRYPTSCAGLGIVRELVARALGIAALLVALPVHAQPLTLRIRGTSVIDARAVPREGAVEVHGHLKDETGRPIGRGDVRASLASHGTRLPEPSACRSTTSAQLHTTPKQVVVQTDGAGAFCFLLPGLGVTGALALRFEGDTYFDRTEVRLPLDPKKSALFLRFAPEKRVLSLDRPEHAISIETRVDPPFESRLTPDAIPLVLELLEQDGTEARELQRTSVLAGDRIALKVQSTSLGSAGPARLRVRFAGSSTLTEAEVTSTVHRTLRVALSMAGDPPALRSGDRAELSFAVGSALGAVPDGAIELLSGTRSLGTAAVQAGAARWTGLMDVAPGSSVLQVRYLPAAPWWLTGEPLSLDLEIAPPSPWRSTPWLLGALALAAWVLLSWLRPGRREAKRTPTSVRQPTGRASVDVVRAGRPSEGWTGTVVDAHDGTGVAFASVRVIVPSFEGDGVVTRADSDAEGRFALEATPRTEGARLVAEGAAHATVERPLPAEGEIVVRLVARRRAILARLVEWAERRGAPWRTRHEPTPAQVRAVAMARRDEPAQAWAEEVEAAAFGPEPPDKAAERRIAEREP